MLTFNEFNNKEQLDEISKPALGKYIKAAQEDRETRLTGASFKSGKQGDAYNTSDETKADENRNKGIDRALRKLTKEATWDSYSRYSHAVNKYNNNSKEKIDYEKHSPNINHKVVTDPTTGKQKHVFKGNYDHVEIDAADDKGLHDYIDGPIKRVLDRGNAFIAHGGTYFDGEHNHEKLHKEITKTIKESVEQLDEIKLKTVGKIIKHAPKIASAAIGATVAAHSVEPVKPVTVNPTKVVKFKQFNEEQEHSEDVLIEQVLSIDEALLSESVGTIINAEDHPLYQKRSASDIGLKSPDEVHKALNSDETSVRIMKKKDNPKQNDLVGARLNINVLKNTSKKDENGKPILSTGLPVLTLHKNTNKTGYKRGNGFYKGEARAYEQVSTLKNAHFNVHQAGREAIATGKMSKHPMASVDGEYQETHTPNFDGVVARFNPMHHHLFVDEHGNAIKSAEHVTLHGHRAYLRGKIEYHTPETAPKRAGDAPSATKFKDPNIK